MSRIALALLALLAVAAAREARAVDGVIEINQARALAGGVTTGDTAGFPVTISQAGSYRLTGNLDSPIGTGAIVITAPLVTLDLGGFAVRSINTCMGDPTTSSCAFNGGTSGILANSNQYAVTVRSGIVSGMAGTCVELLGPSSQVDRVTAGGCGTHGVSMGAAGRVTESQFLNNLIQGLYLQEGALAQGNEARGNGYSGIRLDATRLNGTIHENRVFDNGQGISANGVYSKVSQNVLTGNPAPQISGGYSAGNNICNGALC